MIYAKHFKALFDDLPRESMEYGPKVHPFYESRNPEGPILGEIRLMKHAPGTALPHLPPPPDILPLRKIPLSRYHSP